MASTGECRGLLARATTAHVFIYCTMRQGTMAWDSTASRMKDTLPKQLSARRVTLYVRYVQAMSALQTDPHYDGCRCRCKAQAQEQDAGPIDPFCFPQISFRTWWWWMLGIMPNACDLIRRLLVLTSARWPPRLHQTANATAEDLHKHSCTPKMTGEKTNNGNGKGKCPQNFSQPTTPCSKMPQQRKCHADPLAAQMLVVIQCYPQFIMPSH